MSMNPLTADLVREVAVAVGQVLREEPAIDTRWLNEEEAAHYLRVARSGLTNHRRNRTGPTFCKPGGLVRYHKDDLDAYLRSGETKASA